MVIKRADSRIEQPKSAVGEVEEKKKKVSPIDALRRHKFTEEELNSPRTPEQFRIALRRKMKIYYDMQELRLQMGGRLTKKAPGADIELHPADKKKLFERYLELEAAEKAALKILEEQLNEVPYYRDIMAPQRKDKYKGFGPRMASIIIASFDIHRAETVSQMWSFAGLAPKPCRRCRLCFAVIDESKMDESGCYKHPSPVGNKCKYKGTIVPNDMLLDSGKQARPVAGEKLPYNAWLRMKLCGVLAGVLLKLGSPFRQYYDNYKQRWISQGKGMSDGHRHAAAMRYMIKMVLLEIYKEWRKHEGLPVRPPYSEEYLGHTTSMNLFPEKKPEVKDDTPTFDEQLIDDLVSEEDDDMSDSAVAE